MISYNPPYPRKGYFLRVSWLTFILLASLPTKNGSGYWWLSSSSQLRDSAGFSPDFPFISRNLI